MGNDDDMLVPEDLAAARRLVLRIRRRVLTTAAVTPLVATLLVWLTVYFCTSLGTASSAFFASAFLLLGAPVFVHWFRHYQSILHQLAAIERRVSNGETIYGSQVTFHSYR